MLLNAANSASAHADVNPQPPTDTEPGLASVHEGALEFSPTADYSGTVHADPGTYVNPRLQGLAWCDEHGRPNKAPPKAPAKAPPASQPPAKRSRS